MSTTHEAGTVGPTRLMRLAVRSADQLLAEARADAERMTAAARAEADQILASARHESEELLLALEEARAQLRQDLALLQQARFARRNRLRVQVATWLTEEAATEVG
jgi:cell division septum initiation protein DivIVA